MHLPSIRIAIPTIFVLWCLAGFVAFGPVILFYPAMWAAVALFFLLVHYLLRSSQGNSPSGGGSAAK